MADTETLVVMQITSGQGADSQWFDYRPSFFSDPVRVEWDNDTMSVALPSDTANYLVSHGYARPMTDAEVKAYNAPVEAPVKKDEAPIKKVESETVPEPPAPVPVPRAKAPKRGEQS